LAGNRTFLGSNGIFTAHLDCGFSPSSSFGRSLAHTSPFRTYSTPWFRPSPLLCYGWPICTSGGLVGSRKRSGLQRAWCQPFSLSQVSSSVAEECFSISRRTHTADRRWKKHSAPFLFCSPIFRDSISHSEPVPASLWFVGAFN